jgi:hypothetical protein
VNDCFDGTGTYYYEWGDRYEGEWKDGKRDGQGIWYYSNGDRYEGEWKDGERDGQGIWHRSDGERYEGEWKYGEIIGRGTWYFANGDRYEGEWRGGRRNGQGTYFFANGDRYEGEWKNGEIVGRVTWYYSNGDRYEGEWKDGRQHGQGTYYFANRDRYEGDWKYGDIDGRGTLYYGNGDRYEGQWKDDRQHGHGIYHFANGDHLKGQWVDGERTKVEVCVLSVCFAVVSWLYDVRHFVVALAIVAAVFIPVSLIFRGIRRRYESKRSEAIRSVALSLGMSLEDWHDIDATRRFGPFHLFSQGTDRKVRNCLSGLIDGVDVTTFGYEYTVAGGESSFTYRQTVVLFRSNKLALPEFELRPKTIVEKFKIVDTFKALVGREEDIGFDTHPDFSKFYVLKGNHASAVRQVFSRGVLEYFESHKGLSVEGRDEILISYRAESHDTDIGYRGARVKPDEIKLFLDEGRAVFDLFRTGS